MKMSKRNLLLLVCFIVLKKTIIAQITLLGTSVQSNSVSIPTAAFGSVFGCSVDSINHITRQFDLPGFNGAKPVDMDLMEAADGRLYGFTQEGKSIFSIDTATGNYRLESLFPSFIEFPSGALVQGTNGKLYGVSVQGGAYMNGVLYEYDIALKTFLKKIDFVNKPNGSPILASDGKLYGVTNAMYRYDPIANSYEDNYGNTGTATGYLLEASDGKIYGVAKGSGFTPIGWIFAYDPATNLATTVFTFPRKTLFSFCNGLMQASNGKLYGLVWKGPITASTGSIFEYNPISGAFSFDYDFDSDITRGGEPMGRMIQTSNGKLYGTTSNFALDYKGSIFEFDVTSLACTKVLDLGVGYIDNSGWGSRSGLLLASNGQCYGATRSGGIVGVGEVFKFNPLTATKISAFSFGWAENGANPYGGLTKASTGQIYGCAIEGGVSNEGVIYEYEPITNAYTKKIDFQSYNLRSPSSRLTEMPDGTFYGFAIYDSLSSGFYNVSAIYQWDPMPNIVTKKYVFSGALNGLALSSNLLFASDGLLYGHAVKYPAAGPSTIVLYSFDPVTNLCNLLYDYGSASNNMTPVGNLTQASNGKIYGAINGNCSTIFGRLFEYDITTGILIDKYIFDGTLLGKCPGGGVIEVAPGKLIGLVTTGTNASIPEFNGQLYEYDYTTSMCTMLFQFIRTSHGYYPIGDLMIGSNGKLYGMTRNGKITLNGTVFEYDLATDSLRSLLEMDEVNRIAASPPLYSLIEISSPLPPILNHTNTSVLACNLSPVNISVSIGGTGPFTYQWQIDQGSGWNNVTSSAYYSGVNSLSLTIDSVVTAMDSVYYRCIVTSAFGADTSGTTQLFVNPIGVPFVSGPAVICAGYTATLSTPSSSGLYYSWMYPGGFIPGANNSTYIATSSSNYQVIVSNNSGCADTSAVFNLNYAFLPAVAIASPDASLFCPGDSVLFYSTYSAASYQWLLNGTVVSGASDSSLTAFWGGNYSLVAYDTLGCFDSSLVINVALDCDTWPGDANNDSLVDNTDLLPIGLHYGQTGLNRSTISNVWQAWPSTDWGVAQSNGQDIKQADCNGDGTIDDNDTLAININFSLTHTFTQTSNDVRELIPSIYFVTSSSSYLPGDWVDAELWLGTSVVPVSNLYGIAFNINYDPSLVQAGTESLTYPSSWLGIPGTNAIKISKIDVPSNTAYGAESRINQLNADGYGKIANFKFQLKNTIVSSDSMNLSFSYYNAIDSAGNPVSFNASPFVINIPVGLNDFEIENGISIFPNPYATQTQISYVLNKKSDVIIEVYNAVGQKLETLVNENQIPGEHIYSYSAKQKGYDAGVYFVKINIEGKIAVKKIVEIR